MSQGHLIVPFLGSKLSLLTLPLDPHKIINIVSAGFLLSTPSAALFNAGSPNELKTSIKLHVGLGNIIIPLAKFGKLERVRGGGDSLGELGAEDAGVLIPGPLL